MKFTLCAIGVVLLFVVLMTCLISIAGCAPKSSDPISIESLNSIESSDALVDWIKTSQQTDGCSSTKNIGRFATVFLDKNWNDCCVQHDFDYREGNKYKISKSQADFELWQCIKDSGHPIIANIVYRSVDLFGGSSYKQHKNQKDIE